MSSRVGSAANTIGNSRLEAADQAPTLRNKCPAERVVNLAEVRNSPVRRIMVNHLTSALAVVAAAIYCEFI